MKRTIIVEFFEESGVQKVRFGTDGAPVCVYTVDNAAKAGALLDAYVADNLSEESNPREYYKTNDEWFTYYVNKATGEKKFELEDGDVLVDA